MDFDRTLFERQRSYRMPTRNHSRGIHRPYSGEQYGVGRDEGFTGRGELETGGPERPEGNQETWGEEQRWGAVGGMVSRLPYTTVLTGFGIGFGFGLFVTLLLTRREEGWFERYAPESIQDLPDRLRRVPEAMASYVPDRLKQVPEAVASYVPRSWRFW
jgi:hypothetical protein